LLDEIVEKTTKATPWYIKNCYFSVYPIARALGNNIDKLLQFEEVFVLTNKTYFTGFITWKKY